MNHRRIIVLALFYLMLNAGCSDSDSTPGLGFFPKIKAIASYNVNDPEAPFYAEVFRVGDKADFIIRIEDNDLDVRTLLGTEYLEDDEIPLNGPEEVQLLPQTTQIMTYRLIFPIIISGPVGQHKMVFVVIDARGNESSESFIIYNVEG